MADTVLVNIYHGYGKWDGEELDSSFAMENTEENRKALIKEEIEGLDDPENVKEFISGKSNKVRANNYGAEFDEYTGKVIVTASKNDALKNAKKEYDETVRDIEKQFDLPLREF